MTDNKSSVVFDHKRASSHDKNREKLAPMRDALHLFLRMVFSDLPEDANILCVGIGTGSELIELATAFPKWKFTAVDPAKPMLDVCRKRAQEHEISDRCFFHEGYLDSLSEVPSFHAATSLLVSQFIPDTAERIQYFKQIAKRLLPNGYLINADLASDTSSESYKSLYDIWVRTMRYSNIPSDEINKLKQNVSILPKQEIESIITTSGFNRPVIFYQALLIHAWFAKLEK